MLPRPVSGLGKGTGRKREEAGGKKREGKLGNDGNKLGKGGGCYDLLLCLGTYVALILTF